MSEKNGYLPFPKGFSTKAIHEAQEPEKWESMAVVTPLVTATTFKQYSPANYKKFEYGRSGNPTREALEKCLASLDNAKYGLAFASGLGATTTIVGMLKAGDHIICEQDVYGGTNRLFSRVIKKFNISISMVDCGNIDELKKAITPNTKLIWLESPTNPTFKVIDLKALSKVAREHGVISVCDNTFLTPYLQRPLDLGIDIVVYSVSKYMNGHSDVIMGSITTNDDKIYQELAFLQNSMGIVPSPFDCYQVLRSLKTLAIRMEKHRASSLIIAKFLESHPKVEKVIHPGLPGHPQYELTKQQTGGHSGVFGFYIKNGSLEHSSKFLSSLKMFTLAESLGSYESLAELPSVMTHASVPEDQRAVLKITDNLIRLSVGLEDPEDLILDLQQAFGAAK